MPTDRELTERTSAGDREAFAVLFERHQASVYRFAKQMSGSRDVAEDVTQDVFVSLAQKSGRYDPTLGSLTTYLYGIARHLILRRHKRRHAGIEVDVASVDEDESRALAVSTNPVDALSHADHLRKLRLAILQLPLHHREVIVLCDLNDVSYEEAAKIVGCPVGTVRSRLNRARKQLTTTLRPLLEANVGQAAFSKTTSWVFSPRSE